MQPCPFTVTRLPWASRLGAYLDAHRGDTAAEARRLLDQTGWNHELALHTAVIGQFAAKRNGQANEAKRFLDEAAIRADSRQWTYSSPTRHGLSRKKSNRSGSP